MTIDEKIEILQAYKDGKEIEAKTKRQDENSWVKVEEPIWNFSSYDYRVKKNPTNHEVTNKLLEEANKLFEDAFGVKNYFRIDDSNCPICYGITCPHMDNCDITCDKCVKWWHEEYKGGGTE